GGVVAMIVPQRRFDAPAQEGLRSEEHTSELQSLTNLVCRLLLEKKSKATGRPGKNPRAGSRLCRAARPAASQTQSRSAISLVFFFKGRGAPRVLPLSLPRPFSD